MFIKQTTTITSEMKSLVARTKEELHKKYKIECWPNITFDGRMTKCLTSEVTDTSKVCSIYVTDAKTDELLKHGYTTGDSFDYLTRLEGATKTTNLESLVFGAAKMTFFTLELDHLTAETVMKFRAQEKGMPDFELSVMDLLRHIAYKVPRAVLACEEKESANATPDFDKTDPVVAYCLLRCGSFGDETACDAEDSEELKKQISDFTAI